MTKHINPPAAGTDTDKIEIEIKRRDVGVTTVEILTWSAMLVVSIVVIAGLLQVLGQDVMGYVRDQIGL